MPVSLSPTHWKDLVKETCRFSIATLKRGVLSAKRSKNGPAPEFLKGWCLLGVSLGVSCILASKPYLRFPLLKSRLYPAGLDPLVCCDEPISRELIIGRSLLQDPVYLVPDERMSSAWKTDNFRRLRIAWFCDVWMQRCRLIIGGFIISIMIIAPHRIGLGRMKKS